MVLEVLLRKVQHFILKLESSVNLNSFTKVSQFQHIRVLYLYHERRSDN